MTQTQADWLAAAPFTLQLSAGFFGFFAHAGVMAALDEVGLKPARYVGVSAGALAAGLAAAGLSAGDIVGQFASLRRENFWDPGLPVGGLLAGRRFRARLEQALGSMGPRTFDELSVPLAVVSHDLALGGPRVHERGALVPAIVASCALPGLIRPVWEQRRVLVDGGVSDRLGDSAIGSGERVMTHVLRPSSPWRLNADRYVPPPDAPQRAVMMVPDLPRVSPWSLDRGHLARARARLHARVWLRSPRHV